MSMDELADKIGITKKTLYNHFGSKEELLSRCISQIFKDLDRHMQLLYKDELNAIECMKQSFQFIAELLKDHSPVFIHDLQKMYPEMISNRHTSGFGQFREKMKLNLQKGIKEGLYAPDLDIELISDYFGHAVFGFYFQSILTNSSFSSKNYFVTAEGRKQLKRNIPS